MTVGKSLNLSELNIANYTKLYKELELMCLKCLAEYQTYSNYQINESYTFDEN